MRPLVGLLTAVLDVLFPEPAPAPGCCAARVTFFEQTEAAARLAPPAA